MTLQGAEAVETNRDQDRSDVCFSSLLPAPLWKSNKDIINHISVLVPYWFCAMNIMCTVGYMLKALGLECVLLRNEAHFWVFLCWMFYFLDRLLRGSHAAWGKFHGTFTFNLDLLALSLVVKLSLHFIKAPCGPLGYHFTWLKWLVSHCVILGGPVLRLRGYVAVCIHDLSCFWDLIKNFPSGEVTTTSGISKAALEHIMESWISTSPID